MKYLLTFKPLKHFFFGSNRTFSDDYLAHSEYFPQNTQLLGALRLFIAEQHGLIKVYKNGKYSKRPEELKVLTGTAKSSNFIDNNDLGKINNLSEMFIVNKEVTDAYFSTPLDVNFSFKTKKIDVNGEEKEVSDYGKETTVNYYELAQIDAQYFVKGYDVKKTNHQLLSNQNFWNAYIDHETSFINGVLPLEYDKDSREGVFVSHQQVGIGLNNKQVIEKAFYSKVDFSLSESFMFAAIFDFDGNIEDGFIQIGAESSLFEMKAIEYEESKLTNHPIVSQFFTNVSDADKVVALGSAILHDTKDIATYFSIVPYYKRFGMLKSEEDASSKSKDKNNTKFKGKTAQKRVVPPGSVFYLKDGEFQSKNIGAYAKMGYNQFIKVKFQENQNV